MGLGGYRVNYGATNYLSLLGDCSMAWQSVVITLQPTTRGSSYTTKGNERMKPRRAAEEIQSVEK